MNVIAYDPFASDKLFELLVVKRVNFKEGLSLADYVSLATPLNEYTRGMIGMRELKQTILD